MRPHNENNFAPILHKSNEYKPFIPIQYKRPYQAHTLATTSGYKPQNFKYQTIIKQNSPKPPHDTLPDNFSYFRLGTAPVTPSLTVNPNIYRKESETLIQRQHALKKGNQALIRGDNPSTQGDQLSVRGGQASHGLSQYSTLDQATKSGEISPQKEQVLSQRGQISSQNNPIYTKKEQIFIPNVQDSTSIGQDSTSSGQGITSNKHGYSSTQNGQILKWEPIKGQISPQRPSVLQKRPALHNRQNHHQKNNQSPFKIGNVHLISDGVPNGSRYIENYQGPTYNPGDNEGYDDESDDRLEGNKNNARQQNEKLNAHYGENSEGALQNDTRDNTNQHHKQYNAQDHENVDEESEEESENEDKEENVQEKNKEENTSREHSFEFSPPKEYINSHINKYEHIENPFADPNFDFDKFIANLRSSFKTHNDIKEKNNISQQNAEETVTVKKPIQYLATTTSPKIINTKGTTERYQDYYYYDDDEEEGENGSAEKEKTSVNHSSKHSEDQNINHSQNIKEPAVEVANGQSKTIHRETVSIPKTSLDQKHYLNTQATQRSVPVKISTSPFNLSIAQIKTESAKKNPQSTKKYEEDDYYYDDYEYEDDPSKTPGGKIEEVKSTTGDVKYSSKYQEKPIKSTQSNNEDHLHMIQPGYYEIYLTNTNDSGIKSNYVHFVPKTTHVMSTTAKTSTHDDHSIARHRLTNSDNDARQNQNAIR